jgi:hypothetical protein
LTETAIGSAELVSKGGVVIHSGKKIGESVFKGFSDWGRGDVTCALFCTVSGCLELVSGIYVWIPAVPNKGGVVTVCKAGSQGLLKFRDLCVKGHNSFC